MKVNKTTNTFHGACKTENHFQNIVLDGRSSEISFKNHPSADVFEGRISSVQKTKIPANNGEKLKKAGILAFGVSALCLAFTKSKVI